MYMCDVLNIYPAIYLGPQSGIHGAPLRVLGPVCLISMVELGRHGWSTLPPPNQPLGSGWSFLIFFLLVWLAATFVHGLLHGVAGKACQKLMLEVYILIFRAPRAGLAPDSWLGQNNEIARSQTRSINFAARYIKRWSKMSKVSQVCRVKTSLAAALTNNLTNSTLMHQSFKSEIDKPFKIVAFLESTRGPPCWSPGFPWSIYKNQTKP